MNDTRPPTRKLNYFLRRDTCDRAYNESMWHTQQLYHKEIREETFDENDQWVYDSIQGTLLQETGIVAHHLKLQLEAV